MKRVIVMILILAVVASATEIDEEMVGKHFARYVEAIRIANYDIANEFWSLYDRTITDQLKIRYQDCPVKLEIGTPLWQHLETIRAGGARLDVTGIKINRGYAKINYVIVGEDSVAGTHYMDVASHTEPYLVTPLQVYGEHWDHTNSRYLEVIYRDPSLLEERNLDDADRYIDEVARTLGISKEKLIILESLRARTYLCQSHGEIEQLTAGQELGSFYQPADAVVSRLLPDRNQLAQFLVAYANEDMPPQTLPLFKYGTATFLGGHNGRSRDVSLSLGKYIVENGFTELENLMTLDGFLAMENNPDFSYPVAGLFCEYLFEQLGREAYFQLCRRMSGSRAEVGAITAADCQAKVAAALASSWQDVSENFARFVGAIDYNSIEAGGADEENLVFESGIPTAMVRISEDENSYSFWIQTDSASFSVAIVSGYPHESRDYESFLFSEHFPSLEYDGEHYGVIATPQEVGCYDYFTNEITAKYIVGLTDEKSFAGEEKGEYRFRIDKQLLPFLENEIVKVLPAR